MKLIACSLFTVLLIVFVSSVNAYLGECEVAGYALKAGFSAVLPQIVCTAYYESGFDAKLTTPNNNGSTDYGLWQLNSDVWCGSVSPGGNCNVICSDLLQPLTNANCAYKLYQSQGLAGWPAYTSHESICNSYKLNCGQTTGAAATAISGGNSGSNTGSSTGSAASSSSTSSSLVSTTDTTDSTTHSISTTHSTSSTTDSVSTTASTSTTSSSGGSSGDSESSSSSDSGSSSSSSSSSSTSSSSGSGFSSSSTTAQAETFDIKF